MTGWAMLTVDQEAGRAARELFDGPIFGRNVTLVRTLKDGRVTREVMPVGLAVYEAEYGDQNGKRVASAHVDFNGVINQWDGSA